MREIYKAVLPKGTCAGWGWPETTEDGRWQPQLGSANTGKIWLAYSLSREKLT